MGLRDYKPLVLPAFTLYVPLSIVLAENMSELEDFLGKATPPYELLVFNVGLPLLLLAVAALRGAGPYSSSTSPVSASTET